MARPLILVLKGFCMGAADVVPGVSGGTMAFILGIYRRLLEAIRAFDATLLTLLLRLRLRAAATHTDLAFLCWLGLGIFAALMFFTRVVALPSLILTHPEPVYGLFFGLIVASILTLLRSMGGVRNRDLAWIGMGTLLGFGIVNAVPMNTPDAAWFVFLCGSLAICAMLLPGISGSFILLVLGKYAYVFDAVGRLNLSVLVPFGLGAIVGVMAFSRLLTWLLSRFYRRTLMTIVGILTGSLWLVWPFQARDYVTVRGKPRLIDSTPLWPDRIDATAGLALACMVAGLVIVLAIQALSAAKLVAGEARSGD